MNLKAPLLLSTASVLALALFLSFNFIDVQKVSVNDEYEVSIPKHLYVSHDLNADASLQYNDTLQEEYVIVINESKADFIKQFSDSLFFDKNGTVEKNYRIVQMNSIQRAVTFKEGPTIKRVKINELDAEIVECIAKVEGIDSEIYYKIAFIEGTKNMYMLMSWTMSEFKEKHKVELDAILRSFKLLK